MLVVDLIAGAVIVVGAAWGFRQGLDSMLPLAGFAIGAVLGTRVPTIFGTGVHASSALAVALPAALVLGALLAAVSERVGVRLGHRLRGYTLANALGGAILTGAVAVVLVWILGPVVAQVKSLRAPIARSTILARLDSVLTPAGPKPTISTPPFDNFPHYAGPAPQVSPLDQSTVNARGVLAAEGSAVKVFVIGCHHSDTGSGWLAGKGIVMTNAHVVASANLIGVRPRGSGPARPATAIWFDPVNDIALLRVPALAGVPPLAMVDTAPVDTAAATVGFPLGRWAVRPARLGPTTSTLLGRMGGDLPAREFPRELFRRPVTTFRGEVEPGSSGSPIVDTHGRVLATVFGKSGTTSGLGVPNRVVRAALRRARGPVGTGQCV